MWIFEPQELLIFWRIWVSELSNWIAYKKACRLVEEKNGTMLGHLCLINDNSEMNNNQNNIQIIFLILLFQAVIFLFQVNSFFLNFCQTIPANKWLPKLNNRNTLVFLLLNLNTKCFYCYFEQVIAYWKWKQIKFSEEKSLL